MPNVKLLLKEKVEKLGEIGEIVSVKPGYARNFLLPRDLATLPTVGEIKKIERKKEILKKQYEEGKQLAEGIQKKLASSQEVIIYSEAGEENKLFGRITAKDITEKINEKFGTEIDRKQVILKKSISELGEYDIKIKLHQEVEAQIKVIVKKTE